MQRLSLASHSGNGADKLKIDANAKPQTNAAPQIQLLFQNNELCKFQTKSTHIECITV